jgi:hypothetical protein
MAREDKRENISTDQDEQRWFIDLDYFQSNNRSFVVLAEDRLCADCRKRLKVAGGAISADLLFTTIRDCCSGAPDYITGELPILDSIFRIFLANGNQPLSLGELGQQLSDRRGGDAYRTSPEMLYRLLKRDQYYGIRPVGE